MTGKRCAKCNETKPLDQFYRDVSGRNGRHNYCKPCCCVYAAEWRNKNLEKSNAHKRARYHKGGGRAGENDRLSRLTDGKVDFVNAVDAGVPLIDAIDRLKFPAKRAEILKCLARNGCEASAQVILHEVFGVSSDALHQGLPRYNTLKPHIYDIKRNLPGSGFALVKAGYGKGYALVRDGGG